MLKGFFQTQEDRLIGLDQSTIQIEDNSSDSFLQIAEDILKALKEMAGDILFDAIGVERVLGEDEVRLLSRTSIGEAIADEKYRIVFFTVDLDEPLFTSPAEATLLIRVRKREVHSFLPQEMAAVGIEGDL